MKNFLFNRGVLLQKNFEKLPFEQKALLESAAIIGNKFDAQLLADIWGKDLIEVLHELESLEGLYVLDMNEEDNIYTFISKTMHQVVLSSANRDGSVDSSRQLIVEYQKRIIKSLLNGEYDQILDQNDLEILLSALPVPFLSGDGRALYPFATGSKITLSRL